MKQIYIFLFLLLQGFVYGQYDGGYSGGRQASMGGSAVMLHDGWSSLNNPAGLAAGENITAGIFYEMRFGMPEFSTRGATFQYPVNSGSFGLAFSWYGFDIYNEKRFVLAYGRELFPGFYAGLSLDYLHTHLNDQTGLLTGNKGNITFQAGLQARLSQQVWLGFSVFNPWTVGLSEYDADNVPAVMRLGLSYEAGDDFLIVLESEQNLRHKLRFKSGLEYQINEKFLARGGINTNPTAYSFGAGLEFQGIVFDITAVYHLVLGYSPHGSFLYEFHSRR
ncbi:MAG: hypothetical protein R6U19_08800 [Bacteroidales bacterium]